MTVEYKSSNRPNSDMYVKDIPMNTVFSAMGYKALLRMYTGVVSLENARCTWTGNDSMQFKEVQFLNAKVVIE